MGGFRRYPNKMHVSSIFQDFWREEQKRYEAIEGKIFCSDTNETGLIPSALLRNVSEVEVLVFSFRFWESCCRLATSLDLSYISMRIADTLKVEKLESELVSQDYHTRICVLAGSPDGAPQNGYFYSYESNSRIKINDGRLEINGDNKSALANR